jgi:HTH-type transcriptional regulator, competence development regulator
MEKYYSLGEFLRNKRKEKGLPLRKVAALLDLDPSTLGKIEKNSRRANEEIIQKLAVIFTMEAQDLLIMHYSDLISASISEFTYRMEILQATVYKISTIKKQEP